LTAPPGTPGGSEGLALAAAVGAALDAVALGTAVGLGAVLTGGIVEALGDGPGPGVLVQPMTAMAAIATAVSCA